MKSVFLVSLLILPLALSGCDAGPASAAPEAKQSAAPPRANGPVVVELFQSQGCSSCPPAQEALNTLASRTDVTALSYAITYWDRLGWRDTFADPLFTQRQQDYASALGDNRVYTPQVVLNGRRAIVGNGRGELDREVARTQALTGGPTIQVTGATVEIGAGTGRGDVIVVRYDPRVQQVAIRAGENNGKTLPHRNVVRQLVRLGSWNGTAAHFIVPAQADPALQSVLLVQTPQAGPILAARKF